MSSTFLALYRGATIADARLVAVTVDPPLVAEFCAKRLRGMREEEDTVARYLEHGRREALIEILRTVWSEYEDQSKDL